MRPAACLSTGLIPCLFLLLACSQPADATADAVSASPPATGPEAVDAAPAEGAGSLVGEWAVEPALCAESRLSFTADGRHEALMDDGGGWQVLASGSYERSGSELRIVFQGVGQQREILSVGPEQLVLRHDDEALARATGSDEVVLYRCPPTADAAAS
ncbi:hypothetical protein [Arenimonas sp.]|uniref:hypothetical protein n=1 Tax=Arenimonas sp. TaxID=1872635 RepID=UPI0035B23B6C